ncbi:MAG: dynamin family protein [Propionibacterium sp.]|nr:dynamin family protein [Propionibacterium sp.]
MNASADSPYGMTVVEIVVGPQPLANGIDRPSMPLADQLAVVRDVSARFGLKELAARVHATTDQAEGAPLRVTVLGQFKAGKSSLLNTLIGEDILPVLAIPATSVITSVRHGQAEQTLVHTMSGETAPIHRADIAQYVTQSLNPDNWRQVRLVEVITTALADFPDLEFVDTPGLGGPFDMNTVTSTDWLPNVGAALIAVSATQPLAAGDLALRDRVASHTPHVVVVLTKADLLTSLQLAEVRAFVTDQINTHADHDIAVLPYSTAPGHRALQGAVVTYLLGLQERHTAAVQALTAHRAARLIDECHEYLRLALAAAEADAQAVDHLHHALDDERRLLNEIEAEARTAVRPYLSQAEAASVQHVSRQTRQVAAGMSVELGDKLGSWRGSLAAETRGFETWLTQALATHLEPVARSNTAMLAPIVEQAHEPLGRLSQAFAQRLSEQVRRALGIAFEPPTVVPSTPAVQPVDVAIEAVFDSHLELLSWAIPMVVFRRMVHRHFAAFMRWQVERNALRLAYDCATAVNLAVEKMARDYVDAMANQISVCEGLTSSTEQDPATIRRYLSVLEAAGADDPRAPAGHRTGRSGIHGLTGGARSPTRD